MWIEKVTLDHDDCPGGLAGNEKLFTFGAPAKQICPGGEIGRHVRLRGVCRKVCWFESSPGHTSSLPPLLQEWGKRKCRSGEPAWAGRIGREVA